MKGEVMSTVNDGWLRPTDESAPDLSQAEMDEQERREKLDEEDDELCWECGQNPIADECVDCGDGVEYCGSCLRDHKLTHDDNGDAED